MFALATAAVAASLSRFAGLDATSALTVFGAALMLAILAVLLAGAAAAVIWRTGRRGAGQAAFGAALALALIAYPAYLASCALRLPQIADVATDLDSPPSFMISAKAREARAGWTPPPRTAEIALLQKAAYPKAQPLLVDLEPAQAYQLALRVANDLGWKVVDSSPPICASTASRRSRRSIVRCCSASFPTSPSASARWRTRRASTCARCRGWAGTISAPTRAASTKFIAAVQESTQGP